jgi:Ser/Thr protein kinase RdoA (MazF antagonist)
LPIIRGVAEGLAYAHKKGIVHSDLKPGNVFITADGTPKILDFGIARATINSPSDDDDAFDAGALGAYTEAYATDEMVNGGEPHPADDMYALGLIAYELLTGVHPYQRHSAPSARKLRLKPEPLKGLKRRQARAIERCLSFDRRVRPQDANEFLKAFRGVTVLQKTTLAAATVLAIALGFASYRNYVETGPATPFAALSVEQQGEFLVNMKEGDRAWALYEREDAGYLLPSALEHYARAYGVHPRNREAVAALNRVARAILAAAPDADERRSLARGMQEQSPHFKSYPPVVDAAQ